MRVFIVLLFLTAQASAAQPSGSRWVKAGVFPDGFVHVDTETVVETGNVRKAWFMFSWRSPQRARFVTGPFQSAMTMIYFDCSRRTMQGAGRQYFEGVFLGGAEVPGIGIQLSPTRESVANPHFDFTPKSPEETAFNYLSEV